jgi:hypothetical protein
MDSRIIFIGVNGSTSVSHFSLVGNLMTLLVSRLYRVNRRETKITVIGRAGTGTKNDCAGEEHSNLPETE